MNTNQKKKNWHDWCSSRQATEKREMCCFCSSGTESCITPAASCPLNTEESDLASFLVAVRVTALVIFNSQPSAQSAGEQTLQ